MIHCEEKLLKSIMASVRKYTQERSDDLSFYSDVGALEDLSLQKISIKSDIEFFDKISNVLNVITTIILHPYIINARETLIVRAEQAHGITPEMFFDTARDKKLWKDKQGVMTPAEVYYFQNVDDLKNYENRFIVYLLDVIYRQLCDYVKFYDFLVGTLVQGNTLTQDNSALDKAYERLDALTKKVKRIKGTYFYKEVSKANTHFVSVQPTNVFKHNRAYGECYKFYLRNVTYGDEEARANDMAVYYFTRILLALRALGYQLVSSGEQTPVLAISDNGRRAAKHGVAATEQIVRPLKFTSEKFDVTLSGAQKFGGIFVTVEPKEGEGVYAKNLLVFDSTINFEEVANNIDKYKNSDATAVDAVTLWDAAYVDDKVRSLDRGGISENALLRRYIEDKTRLIKASRQIYEKHCPTCGGRNVMSHGQEYNCSDCGTDYTFIGEYIWFKKLRRK